MGMYCTYCYTKRKLEDYALFVITYTNDLFLCLDASIIQNKQFLPKETLVFVRLVKHALKALDIYTINVSASGQAFIRPAA